MKITVVKIGGRAAADKEKTAALIRDMAADRGEAAVLVHGGGAEVTAAAKQFGIESQFVDGVRFTSMREMAKWRSSMRFWPEKSTKNWSVKSAPPA